MAVKVTMPLLSDTMQAGKILKWLKAEGESVNSGDAIAEVESDKADMEITAYQSGIMRKHLFEEGQSAKVGALIAVIGGADEDISSVLSAATQATNGKDHAAPPPAAKPEPTSAPQAAAPAPAAVSQAAPAAPNQARPVAATPNGNGDNRIKASPLARRIARESGVELAGIAGTGPGGRIVRRDVEAAQATPAAQPGAEIGQPTPAMPAPVKREGEYTERPLTSMRRTIARRLAQSIGPIPTFYLTVEINMAKAVEFRQQVNGLVENVKVSLNDIIIKAAAAALVQHPNVNASFTDEAIIEYNRVHIGVAVAMEEGLITPIVRDADRKSLGQISREVKELAQRAKDRKLTLDEYTGATFSISNLGMLGIEEFTAIINPPESAILAVGGLVEKAVVVDGALAVGKRMRVTMSCDHRVIDGARGAEFLATFKKIMENPLYLMV